MLSRLEREVKLCARMRNARQKPTLTFLQGHMVKAMGCMGYMMIKSTMSWGKMKHEVEMLRDEVWAVDFCCGITLGELYLAFLPPPQTWVIRTDAKWSQRAGPKIGETRKLFLRGHCQW